MNPKLRNVSLYIMNDEEKLTLKSIVLQMCALKLTYRLDRADQNQTQLLNYSFDPPFHLLIQFSGISRSLEISNDIKKTIIREIIMEESKLKLAKLGPALTQNSSLPQHITAVKEAVPIENRGATTALRTCLPSAQPILNVKADDHDNGNITSVYGVHLQPKKKTEKIVFPVLFNYQEGFTNAVRRPVFMKDITK